MAGFMPELALMPPPLSVRRANSSTPKRHTVASPSLTSEMAGLRSAPGDMASMSRSRHSQLHPHRTASSPVPPVGRVASSPFRQYDAHVRASPTPRSKVEQVSSILVAADESAAENPSILITSSNMPSRAASPVSSTPASTRPMLPGRSASLVQKRRTSLRQRIIGPTSSFNDLSEAASIPRARKKLVKRKYSSQFELVSPPSGRNREAVVVGVPIRPNDGQDGVRVKLIDVKRSQKSLARLSEAVVDQSTAEAAKSGGDYQAVPSGIEGDDHDLGQDIEEKPKRWSTAPKLPELDFSSSSGASGNNYGSFSSSVEDGAQQSIATTSGSDTPSSQSDNLAGALAKRGKRIDRSENEPISRESEVWNLPEQALNKLVERKMSKHHTDEDPASADFVLQRKVEVDAQPDERETWARIQNVAEALEATCVVEDTELEPPPADEAAQMAGLDTLLGDSASSTRDFRVDIYAPSALAYQKLEAECISLVLRAGGQILSDIHEGSYMYIGGFHYSLPAGVENSLASTEGSGLPPRKPAKIRGKMLSPLEFDEPVVDARSPQAPMPGKGYIVVHPCTAEDDEHPAIAAPTQEGVSYAAGLDAKADDAKIQAAESVSPVVPKVPHARGLDNVDPDAHGVSPVPRESRGTDALNDPGSQAAEHVTSSSLFWSQDQRDDILAAAHDYPASPHRVVQQPKVDDGGTIGDGSLHQGSKPPSPPLPRQIRRRQNLIRQLETQAEDYQTAFDRGTGTAMPSEHHDQNVTPDNARSSPRVYRSNPANDAQTSAPHTLRRVKSGLFADADHPAPAAADAEDDDVDTIPLSAFRPKPSISSFTSYKTTPAVTPTVTPRPSRIRTPVSTSEHGATAPGSTVSIAQTPTRAGTTVGYPAANPSSQLDPEPEASSNQSYQIPSYDPSPAATITDLPHSPTYATASSFSTPGAPITVASNEPTQVRSQATTTTTPAKPATTSASPHQSASPFSTPRSRLSALFSPLLRHSSASRTGEQTTPTRATKDKAAQVLGIGHSGQSSRFSVVRDGRVFEGEEDVDEDEEDGDWEDDETEVEDWESCVSAADAEAVVSRD